MFSLIYKSESSDQLELILQLLCCCVLTAVAEVVRVHEGDGHGLLRVQSALVSITAIHGVHHVCHLLTGVPDRILALLSQLPDNPTKQRINEDLLL